MPKASKFSPDEGLTIYDLKDSEAVHWSDNTILGAKNIIPFPYSEMPNNQAYAGVTHTINADGSITCSGTGGNGGCNFVLSNLLPSLKKGSYIFSSGVNMPNGCYLSITVGGRDYNITNGENQISINLDADSNLVNIRTWFASGTPVNLTAYPMIRLAADTDDTYALFARTNRELTEKVDKLNVKSWSLPSASSIDITCSQNYHPIFVFGQRGVSFMLWFHKTDVELIQISDEDVNHANTPTAAFNNGKIRLTNVISDADIGFMFMSYAPFTIESV